MGTSVKQHDSNTAAANSGLKSLWLTNLTYLFDDSAP